MYILSVSRGSWDDYYRINIGVFDDESKAKKAGEGFLEVRKNLIEKLESECPIDLSVHTKINEDYDIELLDYLDETMVSKYHEWSYKLTMAKNINDEYRVEPMRVNAMDTYQVFYWE
jgi:hypothetical protein